MILHWPEWLKDLDLIHLFNGVMVLLQAWINYHLPKPSEVEHDFEPRPKKKIKWIKSRYFFQLPLNLDWWLLVHLSMTSHNSNRDFSSGPLRRSNCPDQVAALFQQWDGPRAGETVAFFCVLWIRRPAQPVSNTSIWASFWNVVILEVKKSRDIHLYVYIIYIYIHNIYSTWKLS